MNLLVFINLMSKSTFPINFWWQTGRRPVPSAQKSLKSQATDTIPKSRPPSLERTKLQSTWLFLDLCIIMATAMIKMKQRGSRRKQPEEGLMEFFEVPSGFEFSKPPSNRSGYAPPPSTAHASVPRQPTASEAALSAKNIRFAKELVSIFEFIEEHNQCHCFCKT